MVNQILAQFSNGPRGLSALLDTRKDWIIKELDIVRRPLPKTIASISNIINGQHHDDIYHLYQQLVLVDPKTGMEELINYEKNETMNVIRDALRSEAPEDRRNVDLTGKTMTLGEYIENGQRASARANKHYFNYSLRHNNCQDFSILHLRGNGLGIALSNSGAISFIHQNARDLVPGWLERITDFLSTSARKVGEFVGVS